ncbi:Pyridoxine 4-dehydrogenase [Rubrivivax sp. A210]|uniref:aldo/keto reductase n=1 Tax=Rubrivivax sp. A210 TaxID=2772301 RepID=UPI001917A469|nr:aldo/keto reductase [Rubrivivax sp. A210]CAD5374298.1 Pyridoxine 4-dehydrogenase [Rubrivivax sp. A210]
MNTTSQFGSHSRRIGPFDLPAIGLGCMNLSHAYGHPPSAAQAERLLLQAVDEGVRLFDTAALYGFGANETLLGRVLKPHRQRIVLCSKGGLAGETFPDGSIRRVIDGRPETLRRHCEESLRRLQTETLDVYYLHRWCKRVPIEDSVGEMSRLVERGLVRAIGLSEVSAATLKKAHAVCPIAAVQSEYSPWSRNVEIGVRAACAEIGAALVAFCPLARGFLTSAPPDPAALVAGDIRLNVPRFEPVHHAVNRGLLSGWAALAAEAGCTPAQLALAWVLSRGEHVLPIPGTTSAAHLRENLDAERVRLPGALLTRIDVLINKGTVSGERYNPATLAEVDTEQFDQ